MKTQVLMVEDSMKKGMVAMAEPARAMVWHCDHAHGRLTALLASVLGPVGMFGIGMSLVDQIMPIQEMIRPNGAMFYLTGLGKPSMYTRRYNRRKPQPPSPYSRRGLGYRRKWSPMWGYEWIESTYQPHNRRVYSKTAMQRALANVNRTSRRAGRMLGKVEHPCARHE